MQRKVDHLKGLLETAYEIKWSIWANTSEWLTPDSLAALIFCNLCRRTDRNQAPRQFLSEKCWKGSRVSHEGLGLVPGAVIWRRSLGRIPGCGAAPRRKWLNAGGRGSEKFYSPAAAALGNRTL